MALSFTPGSMVLPFCATPPLVKLRAMVERSMYGKVMTPQLQAVSSTLGGGGVSTALQLGDDDLAILLFEHDPQLNQLINSSNSVA
jgi:hypothetical protein